MLPLETFVYSLLESAAHDQFKAVSALIKTGKRTATYVSKECLLPLIVLVYKGYCPFSSCGG